MYTLRKVLFFSNFLMSFIMKSNSQSTGFCSSSQPVIRICTNDKLVHQKSVNIDTDKVPRQQANTCKCMISPPSIMDFEFTFTGETNVEQTHFIINNIVIDPTDTVKEALNEQTELWLFDTNNATSPKVCLTVSAADIDFNISCLTNSTQSTTTTVKPYTRDSTSMETGFTKRQMNSENTRGSDLDIIIPIVASIAGVVCFSCMVVVIVVCRRRSRKNRQESDTTASGTAEKETEDDYYMTENPRYNMNETEPKMQSSESEYHYIEPDHKGDRMSSNQYESIPDFPVSRQSPNRQSNIHDLHYDYTTCLSASDKNETVLNIKISKTYVDQKGCGGSKRVNQSITEEIMYDHTDTAMPKQFQSVNEYHHISPACSRKNVAIDTYNTIRNAKHNHIDDKENE